MKSFKTFFCVCMVAVFFASSAWAADAGSRGKETSSGKEKPSSGEVTAAGAKSKVKFRGITIRGNAGTVTRLAPDSDKSKEK